MGMHIPTAHIEPDIQATERFGAIRELLDRLVRAGAVPIAAQNSVFQALSEREKTLSTGIGFQIALPHATSDIVSEPVIAFGRSRTGIEFNSLDGLPVQFVLLFIVPPGWPLDEQPFKFIARDRRTMEAIRSCSTAQEISAILNDGSER